MAIDRRTFVSSAALGAVGLTAAELAAPELAVAQRGEESWLDPLSKAKHKAFFDIPRFSVEGSPHRRAGALRDAFRFAYNVPESDVAIVLGAHGTGLAHVLSPSLWEEFAVLQWLHDDGIGAGLKTADVARVANAALEQLRATQARGIPALACKNTITRFSARIARQTGAEAAVVERRVLGGLSAGVIVVPAMIAAAVLAQERAVPYVVIS